MFTFKKKPPQSLHIKERLLQALERNDPDTSVAVFDSCPMYPEDIQRLNTILHYNTNLRVLKLLDCSLTLNDTRKILLSTLKNNTLEELNIEIFNSDDDSLKMLLKNVAEHLQKNMEAHKSLTNSITDGFSI